jgi:hypothetical protein
LGSRLRVSKEGEPRGEQAAHESKS